MTSKIGGPGFFCVDRRSPGDRYLQNWV